MIKNYLELGQIVGTHGIKGEVRINPWCDSPSFAKKFSTVYFDAEGKSPCKVLSSRPHGNIVLMKLEGIESIDEAEKYRNRMIYISREDASLPEGTWFIDELIGCDVFDADSNELYGRISEISETGANDVWHIEAPDKKEYLIPAIKDVVISAEVAENKVFIRPLKGIFDDAD